MHNQHLLSCQHLPLRWNMTRARLHSWPRLQSRDPHMCEGQGLARLFVISIYFRENKRETSKKKSVRSICYSNITTVFVPQGNKRSETNSTITERTAWPRFTEGNKLIDFRAAESSSGPQPCNEHQQQEEPQLTANAGSLPHHRHPESQPYTQPSIKASPVAVETGGCKSHNLYVSLYVLAEYWD